MSNQKQNKPVDGKRRRFLQGAAAATALAVGGGVVAATGDATISDSLAALLQDHYQRMEPEEIAAALARIERQTKRDFGADIKCSNEPPVPDVVFGYALNLSKCVGTRRCVEACLRENNCNRTGTTQNIRVLEMPRGSQDFNLSDHTFASKTVPVTGKWYLPVQCQQCEDPACVQACPVEATWKEADWIVVIDYDWCIGCRYCQAACPYWARRFNWGKPQLPKSGINPDTHYLGNRPRSVGVMEKCTFCIQRTRKGMLPACQEACPTGARVFGNLLDKTSELRWILQNRQVFRLKEEQGTQPNFWYFTDV